MLSPNPHCPNGCYPLSTNSQIATTTLTTLAKISTQVTKKQSNIPTTVSSFTGVINRSNTRPVVESKTHPFESQIKKNTRITYISISIIGLCTIIGFVVAFCHCFSKKERIITPIETEYQV